MSSQICSPMPWNPDQGTYLHRNRVEALSPVIMGRDSGNEIMRDPKIEIEYTIPLKSNISSLNWDIFEIYKIPKEYKIHWKYLKIYHPSDAKNVRYIHWKYYKFPSSIPEDHPLKGHQLGSRTCTVFTVVTGTGTSFFTGTSTGTCTSCTTHLGTFFTWKMVKNPILTFQIGVRIRMVNRYHHLGKLFVK